VNDPLIDLCRTPMTPKAAAAAFQNAAILALTTACKRWGCWFGPRTKRCNRCGAYDIGIMTNEEIDAL
jgi:hypothetical protein